MLEKSIRTYIYCKHSLLKINPENHPSVILLEVCIFHSLTSPWKLIFVFNFYLPGAYVLETPQVFILKHNEVEDQHLAVLY